MAIPQMYRNPCHPERNEMESRDLLAFKVGRFLGFARNDNRADFQSAPTNMFKNRVIARP